MKNLVKDLPEEHSLKKTYFYLKDRIAKNKKTLFHWILFNMIAAAMVLTVDFFIPIRTPSLIFYTVPILLIAWIMGKWEGLAIAFVIAIGWLVDGLFILQGDLRSARMLFNLFLKLNFSFVLIFLLTELRLSLAREKEMSRTDHLTNLPNRRYLFEVLNSLISKKTMQVVKIAVAYLDLDNFKGVNDQYGHCTGDHALVIIAKTIKNSIRSVKRGTRAADIVARVGGDEFVMLFEDIGHNETKIVINRLQKELLKVMEENGWTVTFSIGVVTFDKIPSDAEKIIK